MYNGSTDPPSWLSRHLLFKLHHVPVNQKICLIHVFDLLIAHDTIGDLAPPKHNGSIINYIDKFTSYVLYVGIASKLHHINLFDIKAINDPEQQRR